MMLSFRSGNISRQSFLIITRTHAVVQHAVHCAILFSSLSKVNFSSLCAVSFIFDVDDTEQIWYVFPEEKMEIKLHEKVNRDFIDRLSSFHPKVSSEVIWWDALSQEG